MKKMGFLSRRSFVTRLVPAIGAILMGKPGQARGASGNPERFRHGVASGDPLADRVIIWTRVSGVATGTPEVRWDVAKDPGFEEIVRQATAPAPAEADYTVKVDVGGLEPGTRYFYRFFVEGSQSPVGRTRTLPQGRTESVKIVVVSCANYPAGYFNGYRAIAERPDADVVVHLGDYIYEYGLNGYASENAERLDRVSDPEHELISLSDYRRRHGQYKTDPDLQSLHGRIPFISMWDDHEFANNCWKGGAQRQSDDKGEWLARRDAALQAYYEWMPIRRTEERPAHANYRAFQFGDLASLFMLETRLSGRDRPLDYGADLPLQERAFDISDPGNPIAVSDPALLDSLPEDTIRWVPVLFDMSKNPPEPILDYALATATAPENPPEGYSFMLDIDRFIREILGDSQRHLLGERQERWLADALKDSKARQVPWQILGNQTLVADIRTPNLADAMTPAEKARRPKWIQGLIEFSRLGLPYNLDAWNGFPAARQRLYEAIEKNANNTVVVTGDTHNAWAIDLQNEDGSVGYGLEVAAPSISSPGLSELLGIDPERIAALTRQKNPQVRFMDAGRRGYVMLTFTPESMTADYFFLDTVDNRDYTEIKGQSVRLARRTTTP